MGIDRNTKAEMVGQFKSRSHGEVTVGKEVYGVEVNVIVQGTTLCLDSG